MDGIHNILLNVKSMNSLESINLGLVVLEEEAMRQGEFVLASKLRDSIAVNQARLESIKGAGAQSSS